MADTENIVDLSEFEADQDAVSIRTAPVDIQGYLYEPRIHQESSTSDDSSSEEELDSSESDPENRLGNNNWCTCGHCRDMPTVKESICCREIDPVLYLSEELDVPCISSHPGFEGNCLNPYVIETSFYEFLDNYGQVGDDEPIHELYRYVAYRRFTRWVWHVLGKGVRKVIPSCAVQKIRESWPSEEYSGFKYRRRY